jgi:hypothetical protein
MTQYDIITILLSVTTVILVPTLTILIRGTAKWVRIESKVDYLAENLRAIVHDDTKIHTELAEQMREDRRVNNQRLRYLEEWHMRNPLC